MTRGNTIKYAIISAIFSKASSAFLQMFSLPLAARELGKQEFGVFALVSIVVFVVSMMQLGVGPALSRMIAEASARNNKEEERHAFLSGLVLTVVMAIIGGLLLGAVIQFVPMSTLFGNGFLEYEAILKQALLLGLVLIAIEIVLWHTDRTLEGYLEAYINHSILSVSNLMGALLIFFGIQYFPTVNFLLIAAFIPKLMARIVSTIIMLRRHPNLIKGWTTFRKSTFKHLLMDGLSFSATVNLVYLIEITVCGYLVARLLGPGEVAVYQIFAMVTTIFNGMIIMVAKPYWTAAVNSLEQGDYQWFGNATRKLMVYYGGLILISGFLSVGLGPWLVELFYGKEFQLSHPIFVGHFLFLALVGWRDISLYILIGLGKLKRAIVPILIGLVCSCVFGAIGLIKFGITGMFFGLASGIFLCPAWRLSMHVFEDVAQVSAKEEVESRVLS